MRFSVCVLFLSSMLASSFSIAADFINVEKQVVIEKGLDEVWAKVGGFCAIQEWHPAIEKCEAYDDHGTMFRTLTLGDGATISEKHAGDEANSYSYFITKSPLPIKAYKATFMATGDENSTTVIWKTRFKAKDATDEEAKAVIEGIFDAGLTGVTESFK